MHSVCCVQRESYYKRKLDREQRSGSVRVSARVIDTVQICNAVRSCVQRAEAAGGGVGRGGSDDRAALVVADESASCQRVRSGSDFGSDFSFAFFLSIRSVLNSYCDV